MIMINRVFFRFKLAIYYRFLTKAKILLSLNCFIYLNVFMDILNLIFSKNIILGIIHLRILDLLNSICN